MIKRSIRPVFILVLGLVCLPASADVVINEIMYNPPSEDPDETYVELYNTSPTAAVLTGWEFRRGITFTFPATTLPGNDYLVVCRNQTRIQQLYGTTKTIGNFTGNLALGGETLELVDTVTSRVADRVQYGDRMPWPVRADGNGAALGLINPALGNEDGDHWAAEMVANTGWRRIVTRGVFDPVRRIGFYLELNGEALVDDVELIRESVPGVNILTNAGFESGTTGWAFGGNHATSNIDSTDAHSGINCLHLRATGQGDFAGSSISQTVAIAATNREFFTLSLWAKPFDQLNGIALGSGRGRQGTLHEVFHCSITEPEAVPGSPGRQNVVYKPLPQPFFKVHDRIPTYPAASQPATVSMVVENPAAVAAMNLSYATQDLPLAADAPDPDALSWTTVAMSGTGTTYTAVIPGQPGGRIVRYYVQMTSTNGGATFRRPPENDVRRYYGYYVRSASLPAHKIPIFYIQVNARNRALVDEMADDLGSGEFKGYNLNVRADFIDMKSGEMFNDARTRWRGGVGTRLQKDNIKILFQDEHRWDQQYVANLTPNNQGRSASTLGIANSVVHELERRLGFPSLEYTRWWARVYYDGTDRGVLTMVEQPDRNFLERFGLSRDGQMFKSIGWRFAYPRVRGDEATFYGAINDGQDGATKLRNSATNTYTLDEYMSYAYDQELDNPRGFQDLVNLIQTINDIPNSYPMPTADPNYVWLTDCMGNQAMLSQMRNFLLNNCNVDFMLRKFAMDAAGADTDRVIHNHYWYRGADNRWFLLAWDRDFWSSPGLLPVGRGYALFMHAARWYKGPILYPRTWRLPADTHTGSWPTFTATLWPPDIRQQYYRTIREMYETVLTPYTMKNYTDRERAYIEPEYVLAGFWPKSDWDAITTQQIVINNRRVEVFRAMQTAWDMDPALMRPLVADVRTTPAVPSPAQSVQFQAHAVSSTGVSGQPTTVTLLLKGPSDTDFVARAMAAFAPGVPDSTRTYYYTAPPLAAGQVYEYYVVASDTSGTAVRTTTAPMEGAVIRPRRVMADDNPALSGQGIVINEIMYNSDLEANEYIELINTSSRVVDLGGCYIKDTSNKRPFVFENDTTLAPGEFLVVSYNALRLRQLYGIKNVVGDYAFHLANEGDTVSLYNSTAALIDAVAYDNRAPWPTVADGLGPALELMRPTLDNNNPASYMSVFPAGHRGTPGRGNLATGLAVEAWRDY